MSEKIKFRVIDKIRKEFVVPPLNWIANKKEKSVELSDAEGLDRFLFLQFLGIKDKKNIEACEGDVIVRSLTKGTENKGIIRKSNLGFYIEGELDYMDLEKIYLCEIIGNIFLNPELSD